MPNDQYNPYRNDVIDGYEKERKMEHRGTLLGDVYDTKGLFNTNILITRMELANGLVFKSTFKSSSFTTDTFFDGYGEIDLASNKTKAIRVWSGNDHWLLTEESANQFLKILPLNTAVTESSLFNLIYWIGTDQELTNAITNDELDTSAYALLYHDGIVSGGGSDKSAPEVEYTQNGEYLEEVKSKATDVDDSIILSSNKKSDQNDEIIHIRDWNEIANVYLKKAPIYSKYALGSDTLVLPLYGGMLCIVYKDQSTQDISTFTKFSYFYTLKEIREYDMPTVQNSDIPFDWEKTGGHNVRHVPLVVVCPSDNSKKMRVLDSFDSNITNESRDEYTIAVDSKTMFEPLLSETFKLISAPTTMDLNFLDPKIYIDGLKVAEVTPGTKTTYYSANDGSLFLKEPSILDHEVSLSNIGEKIERTVYCHNYSTGEDIPVIVLKYPISTPSLSDVVQMSGVTVDTPIIQDSEELANLSAKAQISLGTNETESVEDNSKWKIIKKSGINSLYLPRLCVASSLEMVPTLRSGLRPSNKIRSIGIYPKFTGKPISSTVKSNLNLDLRSPVAPALLNLTSHYVPHLPKARSRWINGKPPQNRIAWRNILSKISYLVPHLIKGISTLITKKKDVIEYSPNSRLTQNSSKMSTLCSDATEWITKDVCPVPEDAVITGYDPDSTASQMTVKVCTLGQQQLVTLHHPEAVSENGLIGIRMKIPPLSGEISYGQEDPTEIIKDAKFVAVNSNNEDVELDGAEPYLSIANGGLIAKKINFSSGVANGQVDCIVETTTAGIERLKKLGYSVSVHLQDENGNGFLQGAMNLWNRGRRFLRDHPAVTHTAQRIITAGATRLWDFMRPKKIVKSGSNEEVYDEEPDVFMIPPVNTAIQSAQSTDDEVEQTITNETEGLLFDGVIPTGNAVTLTSLTEFFRESLIATLTSKDEEYTELKNTGFDRNYISQGSFNPPVTLSRDLLEFGKSAVSYSGIAFEIKQGFVNVHTKPSYKLKMISQPTNTVYTYGERTIDLTGASFDLVDTDGTVIYGGLTGENLICEPLPLNVEEIQLEVPKTEFEKTPISVYYMGFKNNSICVTLLHPFVVAQKELSKNNFISKNTLNSWASIISTIAPIAINLFSSIFKRGKNESWPSTTRALLIKLNGKVIIRDNFMRQKVIPIENISQELFDKIITVSGYSSTSSESVQTISISCLGYKGEFSITNVAPKYITEDALEKGETPTETPPEEFAYTPEEEGGTQVVLQEDEGQSIFQSYRIYKASQTRALRITQIDFHNDPTNVNRGLITSLFKGASSLIGSLFGGNHLIVVRSTGLRHGRLNDSNFSLGSIFSKIKPYIAPVIKIAKPLVTNLISGFLGGNQLQKNSFHIITADGKIVSYDGFFKKLWGGIKGFFGSIFRNVDGFTYVYTAHRRELGCFLHRNPTYVPGTATYLIGRRIPDEYPSHIGGEHPGETEHIAPIDMVHLNVYDPQITDISDNEDLSYKEFSSIAFSAQELNLGEYWPSIEEVKQIVHVYLQDKNTLEWNSIKLSHKNVTIDYYSNVHDDLQQCIVVLISTKTELQSKCILYITNSQLSPVSAETQKFVTFVPHPTLYNICIAYLFSMRHNDAKRFSDGVFANIEYQEADEQKVVYLNNRDVTSVQDSGEEGASVEWIDDTENHTISANYNIMGTENEYVKYRVYSFKYITETDYMEVMVYNEEQNTYITKEGLIVKYDIGTESGSLIGYQENRGNITATIKKNCRVVPEFTKQ